MNDSQEQTNLDLGAVRRALGIRQADLAGWANCSASMISLLEGGYRPAGGDVLRRVLEVLAAANDARRVT